MSCFFGQIPSLLSSVSFPIRWDDKPPPRCMWQAKHTGASAILLKSSGSCPLPRKPQGGHLHGEQEQGSGDKAGS